MCTIQAHESFEQLSLTHLSHTSDMCEVHLLKVIHEGIAVGQSAEMRLQITQLRIVVHIVGNGQGAHSISIEPEGNCKREEVRPTTHRTHNGAYFTPRRASELRYRRCRLQYGWRKARFEDCSALRRNHTIPPHQAPLLSGCQALLQSLFTRCKCLFARCKILFALANVSSQLQRSLGTAKIFWRSNLIVL